MNTIEEIKERITIEMLCSKAGLEINKSGFVKSPTRNEKNASVKIYSRTNSFYDYGSSTGGSVVDFYMLIYNVDLQTALRDLSQLAGLDLSSGDYKIKPNDYAEKKLEDEKKNLMDCLTTDERYEFDERSGMGETFENIILGIKKQRIEQNAEVMVDLRYHCLTNYRDERFFKYLESRCIERETIESFDLFFIGDYKKVSEFLRDKYSIERLKRSGLFNEKGNLIFYNHRLIIPYKYKKKIVYMRGRYFDQDYKTQTDQNKYLGLRNDEFGINTPKRFFNVDILDEIECERVFITEGEFDAMVVCQSGKNGIGIPGVGNIPRTSQLKLLKNKMAIIIADNDDAGMKFKNELKEKFNRLDIANGFLDFSGKDINQKIMDVYNG